MINFWASSSHFKLSERFLADTKVLCFRENFRSTGHLFDYWDGKLD